MTSPAPSSQSTPAAIPRIFVSHSHLDNAICRPFVAHLRAALGLADPAHIFYDERSLHAGDDWMELIQREVRDRPYFLVILTPNAVTSSFVRQETSTAIRLATADPVHRRVFPLLMEACDFSPLGTFLGNYQVTDFVRKDYDGAFAELVSVIRGAVGGLVGTTASGYAPPVAPAPPAPDPQAERARRFIADAQTLLADGRASDAILKLHSALNLAREQDTPALRALLAQACAADQQWQPARDEAKRALEAPASGAQSDAWHLALWRLRAQAETQLNQPDAALRALDRARGLLAPDDDATRRALLADRRAIFTGQSRWADALATLGEEERLAPGDTGLRSARLDLLARQRAEQTQQQQWSAALASVDAELNLAPEDPAHLAARLDLLQRAGRDADALALARQLTARPDATAGWWLARARLARAVTDDDAEVSAALDAAARLAPSDPAIAQARKDLFPPPIPAERFPARPADLGFKSRKLGGVEVAALGFTRKIGGVEVIVPPLCAVPAGEFLMGSDPRQDPATQDSEKPQHRVALAAFQIARFPVTVAEYNCYLRATGKSPQTATLDHPVVNVAWDDASAYAAWLAQISGQPWRLPSEAEWEKAARWDPQKQYARLYPWGDTFDQSRANTSESGRRGTTPVGSYPGGASPCGAQDMAGNVWEWTSSVYKAYPYNAGDGRERADSTENRVLRGGSWGSYVSLARAAFRVDYGLDLFGDSVGFRVALAAPGSQH